MLKKFWNKVDGNKRIFGILIAILGCLAKQISLFEPIADHLVYGGLAIGIFGSVHAMKKGYNKKHNGG